MTKKDPQREPEEQSIADKILALVSPGPNGSDMKSLNIPEDFRPGIVIDKNGGEITSKPKPAGQLPDAKAVLEEFEMNPDEWVITNVKRSKWQRYDEEWLESLKITVIPAGMQEEVLKADIEELIKDIKKFKPSAKVTTSGDLAFVFAISDQQIGKKTPDGGTSEFVQRTLEVTNDGVQRLKELRKIGRSIGTVVLPLLGDHVEGNTSQNGKLQSQYASDLGITEQVRVGRRILMEQIKAFAPLADRIIVPVVNGNHDEVTRMVSVDPADGWNVEIAAAVQDACAENPALSHVEFKFPSPGNQTLSIDINGTMLGLFHGHQMGSKGAVTYLSGQAVGQTPLGNCDVWLSGHYHHFTSLDVGTRFWAQCPTLDNGSGWFKERKGLDSHPGVLTMVIGGDYDPRRDISILRVKR
jgi:predicted phosphodiesterase